MCSPSVPKPPVALLSSKWAGPDRGIWGPWKTDSGLGSDRAPAPAACPFCPLPARAHSGPSWRPESPSWGLPRLALCAQNMGVEAVPPPWAAGTLHRLGGSARSPLPTPPGTPAPGVGPAEAEALLTPGTLGGQGLRGVLGGSRSWAHGTASRSPGASVPWPGAACPALWGQCGLHAVPSV